MAVTHDWSVAPPVPLTSGRLDVVFDLGFEGLGEHPPRSLASDLVEVERALFAALSIVV